MTKNEVKVGGLYHAKVSDKLVTVRIDSAHSAGGWNATNTRTGKRIRIKSAQRLRGPARNNAKATGRKDDETQAKASEQAPRIDRLDGEALAEASRLRLRQSRVKADGQRAHAKPKRVSALDAAAQVLKRAGKPMRAQELIATMAEQGLWKSPGGATPHATLYAAMTREARDKGKASRFRRVDRGQFAFNANAAKEA